LPGYAERRTIESDNHEGHEEHEGVKENKIGVSRNNGARQLHLLLFFVFFVTFVVHAFLIWRET